MSTTSPEPSAPPEASDRGWRGLRIEIAPKTIFLILGVVAGVWLLGQLTTVLTVVTVALILVGTFDPLVGWLEGRGLKRGRALVLVFAVASLALAAVVLLMVPPLVAQLLDVVSDVPKIRERVLGWLSGYPWAKALTQAVKDIPLDNLATQAGTVAIGYSAHLLSILGYGISTMFLAIYLLVDPVRSKGFMYAVVPRHRHVKAAKILLELKTIVGGYMRGQLITSLAISVFVFLLLSAFGADNALAIALFAGLTDIIPFVGGYVASTPVVIAVSSHGTTITIIMAGLMVLYQEFESRILVPRVYGRVLRLPPAIVLVSLLVGGTVAGIFGALLSLPIAAGLQMLIRELHVDLPGEATADGTARKLDEQATAVYEHLTEGFAAVDAASIAEDLATMVKRTEEGGPRLSAQIPIATATAGAESDTDPAKAAWTRAQS
ncbi:MAG TPA: AI-2E family transporter [Kofleriaceae bacterium]|nr:AI-2E family transporter [Kofleriaceae bacterium]